MVPRPRTTVLFYIFYLPPWRKNISFTFFIFHHGGRTFLLRFLYSSTAEERFFYVFYLPPWRKNIPFTFFIVRHGGRTSFFYFTIFRHGGRAFFFNLTIFRGLGNAIFSVSSPSDSYFELTYLSHHSAFFTPLS